MNGAKEFLIKLGYNKQAVNEFVKSAEHDFDAQWFGNFKKMLSKESKLKDVSNYNVADNILTNIIVLCD